MTSQFVPANNPTSIVLGFITTCDMRLKPDVIHLSPPSRAAEATLPWAEPASWVMRSGCSSLSLPSVGLYVLHCRFL